MSDIRLWLDDQGQSQYAEVFEQNEISVDILPKLTDEALEKLGVGVCLLPLESIPTPYG